MLAIIISFYYKIMLYFLWKIKHKKYIKGIKRKLSLLLVTIGKNDRAEGHDY